MVRTISLLLCLVATASVTLAVVNDVETDQSPAGMGLPIVLAVPYGGSKDASIPERANGCGSPCRYVDCTSPSPDCPIMLDSDVNTQEFAAAVAAALEGETGRRPDIVKSNVLRSQVDTNVDKEEGTQGNTAALLVYDAYFSELEAAVDRALERCGFALVVDVHSHDHSTRVEFGYLLTSTQISQSSHNIDQLDIDTSSFGSLLSNPITTAARRLSQVLHGPNALGSFMDGQGYDVVPSNGTLAVAAGEAYVGAQNGYTTRQFSAMAHVDAVDLHVPESLLGSTASLTSVASAFATSLIKFYSAVYAVDLTDATLAGCPAGVPPVCDNERPTAGGDQYFFKGDVWDTACNVLLHGACPPVDPSATMTYTPPVPANSNALTLFRRLPSQQLNFQKESADCPAPVPV